MAQISIPESVSRSLYCHYFKREPDFLVYRRGEDMTEFLGKLLQLGVTRFVVKPDHRIGKRGLQNLIGLNLTVKEVGAFIEKHLSSKVQGITLTRFLVMPFVKHESEWYISWSTLPESDQLLISEAGGVAIESQWSSVREVQVELTGKLHSSSDVPHELQEYTQSLLDFFRAYQFCYLEINPLVAHKNGWLPLDFKARLDSCAFFQLQQEVDIYRLLEGSEEELMPEEAAIQKLDASSGASLKCTILNPNGRIWPMIAGGGASIIYFDALVNRGFISDIAFYGEYSGNPTTEAMYEYTATIIGLLLKSTAKNKVLLLGGANANFTDIYATFQGIIKALDDCITEFRHQKVQILVRRGGPRMDEALAQLKTYEQRWGITIYCEGVDYALPHILQRITS
jgi:ATP-citrate lyase beta-subunit